MQLSRAGALFRLLFLLSSLLVVSPAQTADAGGLKTPLRFDGTLEFVRHDGSVIHSILVEIAETAEARANGMMGRRQLDSTRGMLFILDEDAVVAFWMRNTPLSLDIIFVQGDGRIVNIARQTTPMTDDHHVSAGPVKYVVEVKGGVLDRFGVDESARVRWRRR